MERMQLAESTVGPHRVRPGQQVYVTDPQMSGYLPAPSRVPGVLGVENPPTDIMLRFSTLIPRSPAASSLSKGAPAAEAEGSAGEVFLHTLASTATFGRSFAPAPVPGGAGGEGGQGSVFAPKSDPARIWRPTANVDGCQLFDSPTSAPGAGEESIDSEISRVEVQARKGAIFMLDRGDCTFFTKALNALQGGAAGLIIIGYPPASPSSSSSPPGGGGGAGSHGHGQSEPTGERQPADEGLIRPSAEGEDITLISLLRDAGFGVAYMDHAAGQAVMQAMHASGGGVQAVDVGVEVILLDDGLVPPGTGTDDAGGAATSRVKSKKRGSEGNETDTGTGTGAREGRVMVADHLVTNLRLIARR